MPNPERLLLPVTRRQRTGRVDQLARLADLHERGTLTDTEFAAAKAKLLGL